MQFVGAIRIDVGHSVAQLASDQWRRVRFLGSAAFVPEGCTVVMNGRLFSSFVGAGTGGRGAFDIRSGFFLA